MENSIIERSAPGKVILCGEHSVVYGRPAIAVPVSDLRAHAYAKNGGRHRGVRVHALDLGQEVRLRDAPPDNPLAKTVSLVLSHFGVDEPDVMVTLKSDLPIASGMGSGAAVTVAIARALSAYLGEELPTDIVNALTYEVEKIHHGNPSGIDNTVVAWEKPVYFVRGQPPQVFEIGKPFHLLVANSGIASSTREAVADVQAQWRAAPEHYDMIFNCIGNIARAARVAVQEGALQTLGVLLDENHRLLRMLGISLPELDQLTEAAKQAGAYGAKLTGSGLGGNVIAVTDGDHVPAVIAALRSGGAVNVWHTQVGAPA
ncbi:MAG TPA: mevalonate kinase [Anaerolineae bacterium]|nr:mevalonate kinase [Anaerolineae bacterium]